MKNKIHQTLHLCKETSIITGRYRKRGFVRHTSSYGSASSSAASIILRMSYYGNIQSSVSTCAGSIAGRRRGNDAERRVWSDGNKSQTERRRRRRGGWIWWKSDSGVRRLCDCRGLVGGSQVVLLRLLTRRWQRDAQVLSAARYHLVNLYKTSLITATDATATTHSQKYCNKQRLNSISL